MDYQESLDDQYPGNYQDSMNDKDYLIDPIIEQDDENTMADKESVDDTYSSADGTSMEFIKMSYQDSKIDSDTNHEEANSKQVNAPDQAVVKESLDEEDVMFLDDVEFLPFPILELVEEV